jgi:hypothetical protein
MSDWGVGQGLSALYGTQNKLAREDASMQKMVVFDGVMKQKKADQELAQLKEQQYNEQISKFADNLLAPDRNRINNKAKLLSQRVREEIANQGGDMTKFFANGGHTIMSDYKNKIINSEEANAYLENKKNTEFILKVQEAGKGHLLSPIDLDNFRKYGETGEGRITYSGMFNEIEMPPSENYDYGQKIPARDILMSNYAKIYGNYKMMYPDSGEPSREALEAFTDQMYQGRGSEWQRQMTIEKEANRHKEMLAQQKVDMVEAMAKLGGINSKGKSGSKTYDADGNEIAGGDGVVDPYEKGYVDLITGQISDAYSEMPSQFSVDDLLSGKVTSSTLNQLSEDIPLGELAGTFHNVSEKGWFGGLFDAGASQGVKGELSNDFDAAFQSDYAPVGARRVFKGVKDNVADSFFNIKDKTKSIATNNGKYVGYRPSDKSFMADGSRTISGGRQVDYEAYAERKFEVKDIVSVHVGKDQDGNQMIAMHEVDNGKPSKKSVENLKKQFANSTLNSQMAIVLESENGDRFYELIDPKDSSTMNKITQDLGPLANATSLKEDTYNREQRLKKKNGEVAASKAEAEEFWSVMNGNPRVFENTYYDGVALSGTGQYTGKHSNFIKGFYATLAQLSGDNSPNAVMDITKDPEMNIQRDIREYDEKGFVYNNQNLTEIVKSGRYSDKEILTMMYNFAVKNSPEDVPIVSKWINNVDYLNSVK